MNTLHDQSGPSLSPAMSPEFVVVTTASSPGRKLSSRGCLWPVESGDAAVVLLL